MPFRQNEDLNYGLFYKGLIRFDRTKPDGMLRKCPDIQKMHEIGFKPKNRS